MDRIALFTPVYNEAEKLQQVFSSLPKHICGIPYDLVVADDCSDDDSAGIAKKFTSHVIGLPKNSGVGAATRAGFKYIAERGGYDFVIKFDADGQHDISFFAIVASALMEYDLVICSRFHPLSDQTHTPLDRVLLNMIFVEMVEKITGWHLTDVRSGFMGMRFDDVAAIADNIVVERYGIPMELILRIWHRKPKCLTYEIPHPALYGADISKKLSTKYSTEQLGEKADRLQMAYQSLLKVVESLQISREHILRMNGLAVH